jgi:hypothetical protein
MAALHNRISQKELKQRLLEEQSHAPPFPSTSIFISVSRNTSVMNCTANFINFPCLAASMWPTKA